MSKTYMETWLGNAVDLLNPHPASIDIEDIAHHLSLTNRFTGAIRCPYSVAQHSLYVSMMLSGPDQLHGLLHDAHEAYLGDISTPLKNASDRQWINILSRNLDSVIYERLDLELPDIETCLRIKRADMQAMADEKAFLKPNSTSDWREYGLPPPAGDITVALDWRESKQAFIERFWRLYERTPRVQKDTGRDVGVTLP